MIHNTEKQYAHSKRCVYERMRNVPQRNDGLDDYSSVLQRLFECLKEYKREKEQKEKKNMS